MHEAKVSLPALRHRYAAGRPPDHGAGKTRRELTIDGGYVIAKAPGGLKGATIELSKVTVSGTMSADAATLAKGTTVIDNAACEPEFSTSPTA